MCSLDPDVEMKQDFDDSGYIQDETGSKAAMEEYRGSANLLDLSDDVLLYILKNLSAPDLKALGFTCVRLGALVLDHTLWVDVDGGDVPHGRRRVRWMLMRVLGPHTRSLRLTGYAAQATGCLGFVTRYEREDSDGEAPAEEERCDNTFPFWQHAVAAARPPWQPPSTSRPTQYAFRPTPAQPVARPSEASTSSAGPSTQPVASELQPSASGPSTQTFASTSQTSEPGPSQQSGSQPQPSSARPLPSQAGSSQEFTVTHIQSSTAEPMPSTSEPMPFTSGSQASTFGPIQSTSEPMPSTSDPLPSTSGPQASSSEPLQPFASASTLPSESGPIWTRATASEPQLPTAGVSAAGPSPAGPSQASRNRRRTSTPSPRSYSTSNTTCPGPQLTFTHTGLRALSTLCPNLTALELDHCVIDCQTTNIGQFPKTLLRLSLRGTKCFNMEAKTFLFKIQDHLANLEDIDVSYCSWIEPACMLPLSKMPNLLRLLMRECPKLAEFVAYASLATRYGFKTLKVLDLRGSPVGDSEVSALGWLPALEELYLSPSPKMPPVLEHAHYKQDPLPEFQELADWEETDPEYYRTSEAQEAEWTRDEESAQGIRNRFYNCEDPSACILLERMIAEPVSPSEYPAVYNQFFAAQPNVPINIPEQYRDNLARPNNAPPSGYSLFIRRTQEQIRNAARRMQQRRNSDQLPAGQEQDPPPQMQRRKSSEQQPEQGLDATPPQIRRRRNSDQQPGPSGEADKPGTSGQKRKPDKNNDSSSDDDHSPSKVAATTRTVATQTGRSSKNNGKGSKKPLKKTKTGCTPRRVFQITINETISRAQLLRANLEAAANNNNVNNNQGPAGPNVDQPMDVDLSPANVNQNPINEDPAAGPYRERSPMRFSRYARGMRRLLMAAHRAAQNRANLPQIPQAGNQAEVAQVETENRAEAEIKSENTGNEAEKATDGAEKATNGAEKARDEAEKAMDEAEQEKKSMDIDVNPVNDGPSSKNEDPVGPSNDEQPNNICLYAISNRNVVYYSRNRNALNPENRSEAGNLAESAHINENDGNNQATENEAEKAMNEADEGNNKTKDAANQTINLYNGVPGIDDVPLTPEQEERNRIRYENRAHNIQVDQSHHLANMEQNLNCSFHNAARAVLNAFAQIDNRPRPARERQRFFQFREYRRPIVIEEFINSVCYVSRNQRPLPRGVLFAGLIPARLDLSSLVSDSSIRRFGRAVGENILYLGGGPVPVRGSARPDRSNLRILSVTGFRHVTDSSLTHLASAAPHLQTLNLTGTGVSARASQNFRAIRPDVTLITNHPVDDLELD